MGEARRMWEDRVTSQVFPSSWCGHTLSGIFGFLETRLATLVKVQNNTVIIKWIKHLLSKHNL